MQIRPEAPGDEAAIGALTTQAFREAAHSSGTDADIIGALRKEGALIVSLVAVEREAIVGHVAASPVTVGGKPGWAGIGPLSVLPKRQRRGIGSGLMNAALDVLRIEGAKGAVLVGDPDYYERFGFMSSSDLTVKNVPPAYVLGLSFGREKPVGEAVFHPALMPS